MNTSIEPETKLRLDMLFQGSELDQATQFMNEWSADGARVQIAALKVSGGDLAKLKEAIAMGKEDWRDLLYTAGFANDTRKHLRWMPGQIEESWIGNLLALFKRKS